MSKNRNPYRVGSDYAKGFAFMSKKQVITRSQLVAFFKENGKGEDAAMASATVLLSPREKDSKRGDCRGNFSAMGHLYFMVPSKKVKGEEKVFRLRYRAKALARREYERETKKEVKQVKVAAKAKAPAVAKVATVATVATVEAPAAQA